MNEVRRVKATAECRSSADAIGSCTPVGCAKHSIDGCSSGRKRSARSGLPTQRNHTCRRSADSSGDGWFLGLKPVETRGCRMSSRPRLGLRRQNPNQCYSALPAARRAASASRRLISAHLRWNRSCLSAALRSLRSRPQSEEAPNRPSMANRWGRG